MERNMADMVVLAMVRPVVAVMDRVLVMQLVHRMPEVSFARAARVRNAPSRFCPTSPLLHSPHIRFPLISHLTPALRCRRSPTNSIMRLFRPGPIHHTFFAHVALLSYRP